MSSFEETSGKILFAVNNGQYMYYNMMSIREVLADGEPDVGGRVDVEKFEKLASVMLRALTADLRHEQDD